MIVEKFQAFLNQYSTSRFKKGEILLHQGEVPASSLVIKSGIVKTYNISGSGDEKPIAFNVTGEVIPKPWVFSKAPSALYFYEAFNDCEVYNVPRTDYVAFVKSDKEILYTMLDRLLSSYVGKNLRINALEYSKAREKLINMLHYLCLSYGRELRPNIVEINLPLTQADLASLMGLTRETTGIELKHLQNEGIISYQRQHYTVKTDQLNKLLDDDYMDDVHIRV